MVISHEKVIPSKAGALKSTVKSNRIKSKAIDGKLNWIWQYTQKPVYVEDKKHTIGFICWEKSDHKIDFGHCFISLQMTTQDYLWQN